MFLGKAGSIGFEVLDILGSSITSFNSQSEFISNSALKESKVQILAFEVANTIVKGSILMQSVSEENIQILKMEILYSEGVQLLVSTDIKELLSIAAADMREEFKVFLREVVRFGNMCKDANWHTLDRVFASLDLGHISSIRFKEMEIMMQELTNLAQHTFELYHEYLALDRIKQLYQRKIEEVESLRLPQKGKSLMILQNELKHQRKLVRNLKQKSLWSKSLAEIMGKLVDVVIFIHHAIAEAFVENVITARSSTSSASSTENVSEANEMPERLGVLGLALHYASLITQMDNIASCSTYLPSNIRDTSYNGLPANVKACLRSRLQRLDSKEVDNQSKNMHPNTPLFGSPSTRMTMPQVKAEMEKLFVGLFLLLHIPPRHINVSDGLESGQTPETS